MVEYYEDVIFVSGHEHTLQYLEDEGHHFVISGSGSKTNPVAPGGKLRFGAGQLGISRLLIFEDGSIDLEFYGIDDNSFIPNLLFAKKLTDPLDVVDPEEFEFKSFQSGELVDSKIFEYDLTRSGFYKFLFGEHYEPIYSQPLSAPAMNLEGEKGGLKPVKR